LWRAPDVGSDVIAESAENCWKAKILDVKNELKETSTEEAEGAG